MHLPPHDSRAVFALGKPLPMAIPSAPARACSATPIAHLTLLPPQSFLDPPRPFRHHQPLHPGVLPALPPQPPSVFASLNQLISTSSFQSNPLQLLFSSACSSGPLGNLPLILPPPTLASPLPLGFVPTTSVLVFCCCRPGGTGPSGPASFALHADQLWSTCMEWLGLDW